ncbi:MAG: hypothetical protein U1E53_00820 [Dongiaceae bacterium]
MLVAAAAADRQGLFTAGSMPIDLMPDIRWPVINVVTEAGSLATEEVEQFVSQPLGRSPGKVLQRRAGAQHLESAAFSRVVVIFEWGQSLPPAADGGGAALAWRDRLPPGVVRRWRRWPPRPS